MSNGGSEEKVILIVDDQKAIGVMLAHMVELGGYKHKYAPNGKEALRMLREGFRPALILLDVVMPVMNGYEFLAEIRQDNLCNAIPVVMLTSLDSAKDVLQAMKGGAVDYCTKPVEAERLLEIINRRLLPGNDAHSNH